MSAQKAAVLLEVGESLLRFKAEALPDAASSVLLWLKLLVVRGDSSEGEWAGSTKRNGKSSDVVVSAKLEHSIARTCWNVARLGEALDGLDEESVGVILQRGAKVEIWLAQGDAPNEVTDRRLGSVSLQVAQTIRHKTLRAVNATLQDCDSELLIENNDEVYSWCELKLSLNNELYDAVIGGGLVTFSGFTLVQPPEDWLNDEQEYEALMVLRREAEAVQSVRMGGGRRDESPPAIAWTEAAFFFLSGHTLREVTREPDDWTIAVTVCKTISAEFATGEWLNHQVQDGKLGYGFEGATTGGNDSTRIAFQVLLESVSPFIGGPPALGRWNGMLPYQDIMVGDWTADDALPPRRIFCHKAPRDVNIELKGEIQDTLAALEEAYSSAEAEGDFEGLSGEARNKRLEQRILTKSTMHDLQLKLAPRVRRVIQARYRARPDTVDQVSKLTGDALAYLVDLANTCLELNSQHSRFEANLAESLSLARDAEANGDWAFADAQHKRLLSLLFVERERTLSTESGLLAAQAAWLDYAEFNLRATSGGKGTIDLALQAMQEAFNLAPKNPHRTRIAEAKQLQAAALLEQARYEEAMISLCAALSHWIPAETNEIVASSVPSLLLSHDVPIITASLFCLLFDARGEGKAAHDSLTAAARAFNDNEAAGLALFDGLCEMYSALGAMLQLVDYLLDNSLMGASKGAFNIVTRTRETTWARRELRAQPCPSPRFKSFDLAVEARLELLDGGGSHLERAGKLAAAACQEHESVHALLVHGDTLHAQGNLADAAELYTKAIALHKAVCPNSAVALRLRARHAQCLLQTGQNLQAKEAYIEAAYEWETSSLWLGAGIALLRLGDKEEADKALRKATVRSEQSPLPHGYLALLHIVAENAHHSDIYASVALDLALRLGLDDAALLRELGNCFYQVGCYAMAESLFRRAVTYESGTSARSHAQKRLADVLQAQSKTEAAIAEYEHALSSTTDRKVHAEIEGILKGLLVAIGRNSDR